MKKIFLFFVLFFICFTTNIYASRMYGCTSLTGGGTGALDALDITASSTPNSNNLADGDSAIVAIISGVTAIYYFYVFDFDGTSVESSPSVIRPDDYSSQGVWRMYNISTSLFTEGQTLQTFGSGDTTPDVTNGGTDVHHFWQVHQSTSPTITDFDDGNDHSEFSNGDWFVLIVNYTPEIDFSDNSNIEGNANINFTGSASQIVALNFIFEGTQWKCTNLNTGMSTPTNLSVSSIQAAMTGITDADGITLTADQINQVIVMTGAGDVDIPADQCDSATFNWITVESTGNFLNSITSNDASDQFILPNGSALTAGNELDCGDGSSPGQITVMCTRANKWKVTGYMNCTPADGGSAD